MSDPLDLYRLTLPTSGKLKLRAQSLLAEGHAAARIHAAVLLREAARTERRCIDLLPSAPAETRLAAAIEECACLLAAADPPGATEAWRRVEHASTLVVPEVGSALRARLDPRYREEITRFQKALRGAPHFRQRRGGYLPVTARERRQLAAELRRLTEEFPGVPGLWWSRYRLAETAGETDAWRALEVAHELEPGDPTYEAVRFSLELKRSSHRAAEILDAAYSRIDRAPAELCLVHALAEIGLAQASSSEPWARERWTRAQTAASEGVKRARSDGLRRWLKAVELLVFWELQGREPGYEILYSVGLSQVASNAEAEGAVGVMDVIRAEAAAQIVGDHASAA
jgi:hypothetical protein